MSNLPKVIKEGILNMGSFQLKVYVLDNGQRIIDEQGMKDFITWLKNGKIEETEKFSKTLSEFIYQGKITKEFANE